MRLVVAVVGVVAVVLLAAAGCDDRDGGGAGGGGSANAIGTGELTTGDPSVSLPVRVPSSGDAPTELVLDITDLENPTRHGVDLAVDVVSTDGATRPVGTVSPFPPDRPTTVRLPLDAAARRALSAPGAALVITVMSANKDLPLVDGIRIEVDATVR